MALSIHIDGWYDLLSIYYESEIFMSNSLSQTVHNTTGIYVLLVDMQSTE